MSRSTSSKLASPTGSKASSPELKQRLFEVPDLLPEHCAVPPSAQGAADECRDQEEWNQERSEKDERGQC